MTDIPFPPPTQENYSFEEVVKSQIDCVKMLNLQSQYIISLFKRVRDLEETLYKFLGVDEKGRIPGMPGYDGPLKEEVEKYIQLKEQADTNKPEDNPTGFGAYL